MTISGVSVKLGGAVIGTADVHDDGTIVLNTEPSMMGRELMAALKTGLAKGIKMQWDRPIIEAAVLQSNDNLKR